METPAASSDEVSPLTRKFYDHYAQAVANADGSTDAAGAEPGHEHAHEPAAAAPEAPIAAQALEKVASDASSATPTKVSEAVQLAMPPSSTSNSNTAASAKKDLTPPPSDGQSDATVPSVNDDHPSDASEASAREPSEAIEAPTLDFAKRDIGESLHLGRSEPALSARTLGGHTLAGSGGSEHSNLGSRLVKSRHGSESSIHSAASLPDVAPALPADDDERIRTPVGAMMSRHSSLDIGLRQPFGPNTSSRSSSKSSHDDELATTNDTNSASSSQRWDFGSQPLPAKRSKPYEPAKFILHTENDGQTSPTAPPSHPSTLRLNSMSHQLLHDAARDHPHHRQLGILRHTASHSQLLECSRNPGGACRLQQQAATTRKRVALRRGDFADDLSQASSVAPLLRERPLRQLREPRQPMYIPAVLRPTEAASYKTTGTSRLVPTGGNSGSSATPDRRHWKPDEQVDSCGACGCTFSLFRRKHHCRKCGNVFCAQDSRHTIGLDRNLKYNLFGHPCRACASCASEFAKYASDVPRLQDMSTDAERATGLAASALAIAEREEEASQAHYVGSLATAQDWSTF